MAEQPVGSASDSDASATRLRRLVSRGARATGRGLRALAGAAATLFAVLLLLMLGAAAAIYVGWYDVAATARESALAGLAADFALQRSVAAHSAGIEVPARDSIDALRRASVNYQRSCEACHRAPGLVRAGIANALNPPPADLSLTASRWTRAELFWIVRNGIRMTGMPAWRDTYSDSDIWDIVMLVSALPRMSPAEYAELQTLCATRCE